MARRWSWTVALLLGAVAFCAAAGPDGGEKGAASDGPEAAAKQADGEGGAGGAAAAEGEAPAPITLAGGMIRVTPPAEWVKSEASSSDTKAVYVSADRKGALSIEVLPDDAVIEPGLAAAIVKKLKQMRAQDGSKVVMKPKIEKDKRFGARVREKYVPKDGEHTAEQLRMYRQVGKRVMMATVNSVADDDEEQNAAILKAGEDALLSAEWLGADENADGDKAKAGGKDKKSDKSKGKDAAKKKKKKKKAKKAKKEKAPDFRLD